MSGIAGIFHFDGRPVDPRRIAAMTARMAHRGPDGIAHWRDGPAALGQCMFHTTAESLQAAQPLSDDSGLVVAAMDGRIDNHEALTRLLTERGARLRSKADIELVLQAYLMFGEDLGPHVEGDFAIVIRDGRARKVVCLRDAFGHKPFQYHWDGHTFSLASEVAPLLDLPWVPEDLDEATVAEFLALEWHSREATFWQNIRKLPAAHLLVCDANGPRTRVYWAPDPWRPCPVRTEEEAAELYREILTDSVRRRTRTQGPIACEASGGLDSSAVFALAVGLRKPGWLGAPELMGYTFALPGNTPGNDLPHARSLARFLETEIREIPQTLIGLDDYIGRTRKIRTFAGELGIYCHHGLMQDARSRGCTALLTGGGGDEWLSVNPGLDYAATVRARDWRGLRTALRADLQDFGRSRALRMALRHGLGTNLPVWLRAARHRLLAADRSGRASGPVYRLTPRMVGLLEERRAAAAPSRPLAHAVQQLFERRLTNPGRAWGFEASDRAAAELPFERRLPFDDRALVQFVYALPAWMTRRGTLTKALHRRALSGLLPPDILERRDKAWMLAPYAGQTRSARTRLIADRTGTRQGWVVLENGDATPGPDLSDWSPTPRNFERLHQAERIWTLIEAGYVD